MMEVKYNEYLLGVFFINISPQFISDFEQLPSSQSFVFEDESEIYSEEFVDDPNDESFQPSMSQNTPGTTEVETDSFSKSQVSLIKNKHSCFSIDCYIFYLG
jgi:hypothetical protein